MVKAGGTDVDVESMDAHDGASPDDLVVIPPRPRRAPTPVRRPSRLRSVLRWGAALTALVLAGSASAALGWRELADGSARDARPGPVCVTRAVAAAQEFAAVLGDTRPVDRRAVERACAGRP